MVPPMRVALLRRLPCVLVILLGACGTAALDRPVAISLLPTAGEEVRGPLRNLRVGFDEPVRILNPNDVRVFVDDLFYPTAIVQPPDDPQAVWIHPATEDFRFFFPAPARIRVEVAQGAVVNANSHYADRVFVFEFTTVP
jgi:hypothetical protein